MQEEIREAFNSGEIPGVIRLLDAHFGDHSYSLKNLFKDEKRRILNQILDSTLKEGEDHFRQIYEDHYPVMQVLKENHIPLPKAFRTAVEFILNTDFRLALEQDVPDIGRLQKMAGEFKKWSFEPDRIQLGYAGSRKIDALMGEISRHPEEASPWKSLEELLGLLFSLPLELNLWKSQNGFFEFCLRLKKDSRLKNLVTGTEIKACIDRIGRHLKVKCP